MRAVCIFVLLAFSSLFITAEERKSMVEFETLEVDLGELSLKDSRDLVFYYTNKSTKPLVILGVKTTCGCTKVKYDRKPLAANQKDSLMVTFKPAEQGVFYKKAVVTTSFGEKHTLILKGIVE